MEFKKPDELQGSNLGFSHEVPPLLEHVKIIFDQQELEENEAFLFFTHFQKNGWQTKTRLPIKNWKHILDQWIWDLKTVRRKK
ncbi:hypothetical protein [Algoriphagus aquimarinus]|mgnify:FL=1|uniref:hypothetical protein n=1 Tax=Algoriphagus aquimarinus TaxID=237018 RepID=UPI0030DB55F4|tara:strand:- start:205 stop:453 length:249 start_codon:yes stop_codon:yes gene_type:complete